MSRRARQEARPLEEGWMTRSGAEESRQPDPLSGCVTGQELAGSTLEKGLISRAASGGHRGNRKASRVETRKDRCNGRGDFRSACRRCRATGPEPFAHPSFALRTTASLRAGDDLAADIPARLAQRKVYISARGEWLRVTPHLYNDEADVARLVTALEEELGEAGAPAYRLVAEFGRATSR